MADLKILEKVRKLIDKADDPAVGEHESDALRAKADELMLKYAIEQAELERVSRKHTEEPVSKRILVTDQKLAIRTQLCDLLYTLAKYNRCQMVAHGYNDAGDFPLWATLVGFPTDIEFTEMLFTSLRLEIARNIHPKPDPRASYEDNLITLKEAGLKWADIFELLKSVGQAEDPFTRNKAVRYTKDYTKACDERGRERMYVQPVTHQRSWMAGFNWRISQRLAEERRRMEDQFKDRVKTRVGGTDLVLRDRNQRVLEMYDHLFPNTRSAKRQNNKIASGSWAGGEEAAKRASLNKRSVKSPKQIR